jgi:hypothetical protein
LSSSARRLDLPFVEGGGDLSQAPALGFHGLNERQDVRGELLGGSLVAGDAFGADLG